jgi:hypothetical protein
VIEGTPVFNGLAVLEVEGIDFMQEGGPAMLAHAAFVNSKNGKTYGRTSCRVWSEKTKALLTQLRESMEEDMANTVFEGGSEKVSAGGPVTKEPGGLGEHVDTPGQI